MPQFEIRGIDLDAAGRCKHYHQDVDVVALWCVQCQAYYACFACHDALCDHAFVPMSEQQAHVLCGACGQELTYAQYLVGHCPHCLHPFNPRCALHHDHYFCQ